MSTLIVRLMSIGTQKTRYIILSRLRRRKTMGNYIHKCELCGETFDLYNGEGWGESYIKEGAMLPSTRYVCMKCIKKRKENKK